MAVDDVGNTSITSMGLVAGDKPLKHALLLLIVQIVIIVSFSRIVSFLFRPLRQPRVVAEIVGGILLGPTAIGRIPAFRNNIFPPSSIHTLGTISEFGLMFFLFLVGLELDLRVLRKCGTSVLYVAASGITLPFVLGVAVAYIMYETLSLRNLTSFGPFLLFTGVSLSITAFPVLARILAERKILNTEVGKVAISAAALNDVVAWALLALAMAVTNSGSSPLVIVWVLLFGALYLMVMFILVRPLVYALAHYKDPIPEVVIAITFLLMLLSSLATDAMGIHVIFGAFVMGLVVPKDGPFAGLLIDKVEDFVTILLLPLYFTSSGLKTELASLNSARSFYILVLVTVVAIAGKVVGTAAAVRAQGMEWRKCLSLGFLMSTKGLVELIVLNIGLSKGILNKEIFAILVVMALVTTAMTTPMLMWLYKPARDKHPYERRNLVPKDGTAYLNNKLRMMVCVHGTENIPGVMNVIMMTQSRPAKLTQVDALHLMKFSERSSAIRMAALVNADDPPFEGDYEVGRIRGLNADVVNMALKDFSRVNKIKMRISLAVSGLDSMHEDICIAAANTRANIIVLPFHKNAGADGSLESGDEGVHSVNDRVMKQSPCSVAILVDRGFGSHRSMPHVLVLFFGGPDDREALLFAQRMDASGGIKLTVVHCLIKSRQQRTASLMRLATEDLQPYLPRSSAQPQKYWQECRRALQIMKKRSVTWLWAPWREVAEAVDSPPSPTLQVPVDDVAEVRGDAEGENQSVTLSMDDLEEEKEKRLDMQILGPLLATAKLSPGQHDPKAPIVKVVEMDDAGQALQELFSTDEDYGLILLGFHKGQRSAIQRTVDFQFPINNTPDQGLGPVGNFLLSKDMATLRSSLLVVRQHRPASDEPLGGLSDLKPRIEPADIDPPS